MGKDKGDNHILHWNTNTIYYKVETDGAEDNGLDYNSTKSLIQAAYTAWDNVTTANVTFVFDGSIDTLNYNDGINSHVWINPPHLYFNNVFYDDPSTQDTIEGASAFTFNRVNANDEILETDIVYNGKKVWKGNSHLTWYNEVQSVATHEIGHSFGMDHADTALSPDPVMTYGADPSSDRRTLKFDDKEGISFLFGGNIIDNETSSGHNWFNWDINIISGKTVTISSGSLIDFQNNSSLSVDGHLQVNGTSGSHVTFDFQTPNSGTQNGIKVNSGGTITATYLDVENAYRGIYFDESYGTVNYCTFEDCATGLSLYRTNYAAQQPNLNYNTVFKNTYDGNNTGIYCSYSSPYMTNNEVYNYYTGIGAIYNSSPSLGYSSAEGKNNLHDNYKNLHAISSSNPFMGTTSYQGKNKLEDELSLNILAQTNCNITAEQNWWGSNDEQTIASTISTSSSTVDFIPYLNSSPFRVIGPPEEHVALSKSSQGVEELFKAQEYIVGKEYEKSLEIIRKYRSIEDLNEALFAMDLILQLNRAMTENGLSFDENSELNSFKELNKNKTVDGFIDLYLTGKLENNRLTTLENVKNNYASETEVTIAALFTEFMIYFNELNDYEGAKNVLKLAFNKNPDHPLVESATELLEDIYPNIRFEFPKSSVPGEDITSPITDYSLFSNYPNPFNPQTTISYYIPEISQVKVEIIDINGSFIKTFNEGTQQAGLFTVTWDGTNSHGTNVASGIYLYRISAISTTTGKQFIDSKKMILLK